MYAFETVELTPAEIEESTHYEKSFGAEWVKGALLWKRADKYVKTNLEHAAEPTSRTRGWRCYQEGEIVWKRKDGQPITQDDIDALNHHTHGQGNTIVGNVGDMTVEQRWFCDSSD